MDSKGNENGRTEMRNWKNIDYLRLGTPSQKKAWKLLNKTQILSLLSPYSPVMIGTIPIDIDIEGSDIDIACEVYEPFEFIHILENHYPKIVIKQRPGIVIARMSIEEMDFEIYGENRPVSEQNGYVHMIVEAMLLELGEDPLREKIRQFKLDGLKTEPAFARYLGIDGDPYAELAGLAKLSLEQMKAKFF